MAPPLLGDSGRPRRRGGRLGMVAMVTRGGNGTDILLIEGSAGKVMPWTS